MLPQRLILMRIGRGLELYHLLDQLPKSGVKTRATAEPGRSLRTLSRTYQTFPVYVFSLRAGGATAAANAAINDRHFKWHGGWLSKNAKECNDRQFSILSFCLKIIRNLLRPSPAGRTAPPIGLGFFLSVTATSAVRFFHPMDARWCCPSTVFSFLLQLCSCYFSITYFYCQPAILIIVCMFCGPFVLAHGCYMTREFRREHQDTVVCNCWSVTRKPLHLIKVISVLWTLGEQRYLIVS